MQRRIDQADDYRVTVLILVIVNHRLEQTFEIGALGGQQFIQGGCAVFTGFGQDHALDDRQTFGFKEHVLGTAQANTLGAVRAGALGIFRIIGIGPNLQTTGRCPWQSWRISGRAQISSAQVRRVSSSVCSSRFGTVDGDFAQEDFTGGAIDRNPFAFFDNNHH